MAQSDLAVRSAHRQENPSRLMELYDQVLAENLHFVRNEKFFNYLLQYPGVDKDSVLIAELEGKIMGLAVISIADTGTLRQGNVIELLARDPPSMRALIRAAVNYCEEKKVDSIVLVPPPARTEDEIFKDWIRFEPNVMMTKILSLSSLLQTLFSNEKIKESYAGRRVGFQIGKETVEVEMTSTKVDVNNVKSTKVNETRWVSMTPQTFLKIIFGQMNPYVACLTRRVKVQDVKNTHLILKLLRLMQLKAPLYISLADKL